jgi:hypothetical protein
MEKQSGKNSDYIHEMWKTQDHEVTIPMQMLREIGNDEIVPRKHNFIIQNEIHEKIRNDEDYDDWEYGTEPIWERKKS